jgi:hypothetical protein
MGRESKTIHNITEKQKAYADLVIEGKSSNKAITAVYDVANRHTASSMSYTHRRHPGINAYIQKQLSTKAIADEVVGVNLRGLKAKKLVRSDDGYIEMDDHTVQMAASKEIRVILKEAESHLAPTTIEEDDTYHRNWFIHENGREPTPLELRQFREVIDVVPEDTQIHVFRSEKIAVSLMPKDFIKDVPD